MSSVSSTPDGGYQYYQKNLSDLESEMRDETRHARQRYDERADDLEKNYEKSIARHEQATQRTVDDIREHGNDEIHREREAARTEVAAAKAQTYDKFGRSQAEIAYHQKRADEAIRQAREEADLREQKLAHSSERAAAKIADSSADAITKAAEKQRVSRQRESDELRKSQRDLIDSEKTYMHEKGQGTIDARREIEDEARTREYVLRRQYDGEIEKLHQKADESERYASRLNQKDHQDREVYYTGLLKKQNSENQGELKMLRENDLSAIQQERDLNRKQAAFSEATVERQAETLGHEREAALKSQAETLTERNRLQKAEDTGKIDRLEQQLHNQMTSSDGTYISPAVEAKMRQDFTDEYEKKLQAEVRRNKDRNDSLHGEYAQRLTSTVQNAEAKVTKTELTRQAEEHAQRQDFLAHISDVERDRDQALKSRDYEAAKQANSLNRNFTSTLERQRRDYETLLNQTRTDANEKITQLRQQAEFDAKMAQRNFAAQQNELIRNHQHKLDEQKNLYEDAISELKEQMAQTNREAERRTHQLLDEQAKGYEQKIAQMEFQTKERERTISDNYQDQMEKLKRSNALLIQRKSAKS